MRLVATNHGTLTVSGGSGTAMIRLGRFMLRQILVSPNTSTTTYDITLTDVDGFIIYYMEDIIGDFIDDIDMPSDSNLTLTILNASADENFTYKIKSLE